MTTPPFSIVSFSREHSKVGFCSGSEILDRYVAERAGQDIRRNLTKCFVAIDNEHKNVAGFYTLSAAQIPLMDLPEPLARKMPRYDAIPASRLGRLAIDKRYQKKGLGSALIVDALKKSSDASMAVYALLVDAKDEKAEEFYRHHGFIHCIGSPQTLFLPLGTPGKS
ncbi:MULTISPECIES: GNAT family N-acetyltransferase [Prosthecochloris]|uniref:GNAT family N-acetyltransferase n=1 Tax=Prosthecochloris vibrioformis TaxID=1098 RepID=A0A5C4RYQ2_PROVB|nr:MULTISPECIES: GNAT family N-acetyltransferase [Prosthecochloris]ANT63999.1 putative acetyltransferase [Prosthecochloris sp. CIB 2401]TNJ36436.1 GNAT family N-acetyltransferase [Prosthecochloris vibrioformis]